MKLISVILFILIAMPMQSQVYISEKTTGHKVEFLIITQDSVCIETYTMRYKLYIPLTRKINKYRINQMSEEVIKTDKFNIIKESSDILVIEKVKYFSYLFIGKPGDFIYINNSFGSISNIEKLNSCRNFYEQNKRKLMV